MSFQTWQSWVSMLDFRWIPLVDFKGSAGFYPTDGGPFLKLERSTLW